MAQASIVPTLIAPPFDGIRNFHVSTGVLTVAALWAMEWRRMRAARTAVVPTT